MGERKEREIEGTVFFSFTPAKGQLFYVKKDRNHRILRAAFKLSARIRLAGLT